MANESMLTSLLRGPDGRAQSFLEGVFNPVVQYDDVTNAIFGPLSNDDHNALRRTNSTMDRCLMALKPDGALRHRLEALRDTCDVIGRMSHRGCPNGLNSSARLTRCSRQENEPGFAKHSRDCHDFNKDFLVCTTCDERIREQLHDSVNPMGPSHWPVCIVCVETQERKYPLGGRLCDCITIMNRRVLCENCSAARVASMNYDAVEKTSMRDTIWRDNKGEVKFGHRPRFESNRCLGCGVAELNWDPNNYSNDDPAVCGPHICVHCRKYTLAPYYHPPILLRSARSQDPTHIRLSYHGIVGKAYPEAQGPHGFSPSS